ncbi:MAG: hypothetical protein M1570_10370 [Chloroflexi bacterium]|nr:hypothetical protein [Chloroflexota bacterium]
MLGRPASPMQVAGEFKGIGQSWVTVLTTPQDLCAALVSPSVRKPSGWGVENSITVKGTRAPSGSVDIGCFNFLGLWLIVGRRLDPRAASLQLQLREGDAVDAAVQNDAFLVVRELDPAPFEVTVQGGEGQALERFSFPPRGSRRLH